MTDTPNKVVDISDVESARQAREFIDPRNRLGRAAQRVQNGSTNPRDLIDTAIREKKLGIRPEIGPEGNPSVEGPLRDALLNQAEQLRQQLLSTTDVGKLKTIADEISDLGKKLGYTGTDQNARSVLNLISRSKDVTSISDNVLNNYTMVQYHIALSMLPIETCTGIQDQLAKHPGEIKSINIESDLAAFGSRTDRSVTVASTGENQRNVADIKITQTEKVAKDPIMTMTDIPDSYDITNTLAEFKTSEWNYFNIESVTLENVLAPSASNPAVAEMITLKMRIVEPHGFKLVEDLRLIANSLGYQYVPSTRVMYRVDIWFSGFDSNGMWIPNIPFKSDYATETLQAVSYFVNIATVDAKLDGRGAVYEIGFVPSGHQAWRPEDVVFDSITVSEAKGDTFGAFLDTLQQVMEEARKNDTNNKIKRKYRFYAPDVVRASQFNQAEFFNKKNMLDSSGGTSISKARNVDVIKLIEDAWADCQKLQDLFLADSSDNASFLNPRVLISVEFNTLYGENSAPGSSPPTDAKINDFDIITHQYKLVPYVSFKKGLPTEASIMEYVDPKNQISRIKEMIRYGMIQRVYNYINTGLNTEILNLDLTFQNFYNYQALWPHTDTSPNTVGIGNSGTAGALQQANQSSMERIQFQSANAGSIDRILKQVFGEVNVSGASPSVNAASPYQRMGIGSSGMNTLPYPDLLRAAISSEGVAQRAAKYMYYRTDHLQRDMLVIDMEIRGDPIWLLSSYANASLTSLDPLDREQDVVIVPKADRAIFLRLHAPVQNDYMNSERTNASSHPMIVGGFYLVMTVQTTFSGGKFVQKLNCAKYDHLNYIEQFSERGYGKLFLIPAGDMSGADSGTAGSGAGNGAGTTPGAGGTGNVVPDTGQVVRPATVGTLPEYGPSKPDATSSTLGLKNNNPGNIRPGGNFDGTVGRNSGFDVYDSPQRGVQNILKNLVSYNKRGDDTIAEIARKWAPPGDGNNTSKYTNSLSAYVGISPNQQIDYSNKDQVTKLIRGIIVNEVGSSNRYTEEYIKTSLGW